MKETGLSENHMAGAISRNHKRADSLPISNRRHSMFLPSSPAHPPPVRQLQASSLQSGTPIYQAYKPFASRYQVPQTIPEEDSSTGARRRLSMDAAYLPGDRTRLPLDPLPASLAAGPRLDQPV